MIERDTYFELVNKVWDECYKIMANKNADYADTDNPFANFKACEVLGVDYKKGILVRCMDKIKRVSNLLEREARDKNESIEDTLMDTINYFTILLVAVQIERGIVDDNRE